MLKNLNINGKLLSLDRPRVMGILNITPDSFYAGSRVNILDEIIQEADGMLRDGADILDVGGYSSRPGAEHISEKSERQRIIEPIKELRVSFPDAVISVDTFRMKVASAALEAGANIVNDISAGHLDQEMAEFIGKNSVPYIAMHMKGNPQNMKELANYDNLLTEVNYYFSEVVSRFRKYGANDIIIDPGFGFAKNITQNFELLNKLDLLKIHELPILAGLSRKSMIYKTLSINPEQALNGTTVLNTLALLKGANILRVHDVKEAVETITLFTKTKPTI
jgi:dihydropteroate synthase